jgi:hypothetical protein
MLDLHISNEATLIRLSIHPDRVILDRHPCGNAAIIHP